MGQRVSSIRNLRTIKALRGDALSIDLGREYTGTLRAWMKKNSNSKTYREFVVVGNRYLTLEETATIDYYTIDNKISEEIGGKWYFDVEQTTATDKKTIYTGTILFVEDITGNNGLKAFVFGEGFQNEGLSTLDGGAAETIYLSSQNLDGGLSVHLEPSNIDGGILTI